jgi:glycerophosphoryl diester phosphodiesterase
VILARPAGRRPLVVGHRGAAALAPENTLESLAAGVEAGADAVEFDVDRPDPRGPLVLAHSAAEVPERAIPLDEALAYLAGHAVLVHADVKPAGIEAEVAAALRRHGLVERAYVSSTRARVLRRLEAVAPELERALGYPRDTYGAASLPWPRPLSATGAAALRAAMPLRVPLLLRASRAGVLALHHALVSPAVVRAAHARGAGVLAWTANDPALVRRLADAGVDAVASDDPRMALEALATLVSP